MRYLLKTLTKLCYIFTFNIPNLTKFTNKIKNKFYYYRHEILLTLFYWGTLRSVSKLWYILTEILLRLYLEPTKKEYADRYHRF